MFRNKMTFVNIYQREFKVNQDEFIYDNSIKKYDTPVNLGLFERIISLIEEISIFIEYDKIYFINSTHGGYIPIICSNKLKNIFIYYNELESLDSGNFLHNKKDDCNINILKDLKYKEYSLFKDTIIIEQNDDFIIITEEFTNNLFYFKLSETNYNIYVSNNLIDIFENYFKYCLSKNILNYDNLINLCIMVKNAGDNFENILKQNLDFFDKYTILDTGSTDNTVDIIKKAFINKKGNIYIEDFINFRDSRNRLLDLAGNTCKYIVMLDDTYVISDKIRSFLRKIRGTQKVQSFALYIKTDFFEYVSNRILDTRYNLKYMYKIHEVIEKNVTFLISDEDIYIYDHDSNYMQTRSIERKKLDLKLLLEELEETPNNPRTQYYIAQTYYCLLDPVKSFEWYNIRINNKNEGFLLEKIDSIIKCGNIAKWDLNMEWNKCMHYFLLSYDLYKDRSDGLVCIADHYLNLGDIDNAYIFLKKSFQIGLPKNSQFNIIYSLNYFYVPFYLSTICYIIGDYNLGKKASDFFLQKNDDSNEYFNIVKYWNDIYNKKLLN